MIPKNRIHLSRYLHAQTTPYPEAGRWIKRGFFVLLIIAAAGIYGYTKRPQQKTAGLPPVTPKEILGEQQQAAKIQYETYSVKKGDTLFNISQKFQISWQTVADLNSLQSPYTLKIGQQLKIPKK